MQLPPASVQAAWPTPNYIDPVTHGEANTTINGIFYPLVILVLLLRLYTRVRVSSSFGLNDTLILVALLPATIFFIVSLLAMEVYDWKRHWYDIPLSQAVRGLKMILVAEVFFATGITLTKLSMLTLIRQIHERSNDILWRRIINLAIIVVTLQGSIFIIIVIFQCRPPSDFWTPSVDAQPNCVNQETLLLVGGIINTLTDFVVVMLPLKTVLGLGLPGRQKIVVAGLFALGLLSAGAGVARTYYTYKVTQTWDQTWAAYPVWLTTALELYIGMICCSIPATKPFFTKYYPRLLANIAVPSRGAAGTKDSNSTIPLYDYSNTGAGGKLGTVTLDGNRMWLRRTSAGSTLKSPGWMQERSHSVFEE